MTPAEWQDLAEHLVEVLVQVTVILKVMRNCNPVVQGRLPEDTPTPPA